MWKIIKCLLGWHEWVFHCRECKAISIKEYCKYCLFTPREKRIFYCKHCGKVKR